MGRTVGAVMALGLALIMGCYLPMPVPPAVTIPPPATTITPNLPSHQPGPIGLKPVPAEQIQTDWKPHATERTWKYIVLHHTATDHGDVASIHETHVKKKDASGKPWLGIGYHFVIGNGQGMGDGEIEPTFRWREQLQGAHAGVANYNQEGIGIVLVGNFEVDPPSPAQLGAVRRLVATLKQNYVIDADHVIGHRDVKATECPGRHFPLEEIRLSQVQPGLSSLATMAVPSRATR